MNSVNVDSTDILSTKPRRDDRFKSYPSPAHFVNIKAPVTDILFETLVIATRIFVNATGANLYPTTVVRTQFYYNIRPFF